MRHYKLPLSCAGALSIFLLASGAFAEVDKVQLGDAASEQLHHLEADHSQISHGGLDETARQLLPLEPIGYAGGTISFALKVDPQVYVHIEPRFVPDDHEKQGPPVEPKVRTSPGEEVIEQSRKVVIGRLSKLLGSSAVAGKASDQKARAAELLLLGDAYNIAWTPAYHDPRAIDRIVFDGDSMARDFAGDPKYVAKDWAGGGPAG